MGRFCAPQWYEALPFAALGRGLDHPWFDRTAFEVWWQAGELLALPVPPG
jgi:hypothetical protein